MSVHDVQGLVRLTPILTPNGERTSVSDGHNGRSVRTKRCVVHGLDRNGVQEVERSNRSAPTTNRSTEDALRNTRRASITVWPELDVPVDWDVGWLARVAAEPSHRAHGEA